jgi:SAM-dependent methyltransferase
MPAEAFTERLGPAELTRLFGVGDLSPELHDLIAAKDLRYRVLDGDEHEQVLRQVLATIDSDVLPAAGPERRARWERGWAENRDAFLQDRCDPAALVPRYYRSGRPLRLRRRYVRAASPSFELDWYDVFRRWLFRSYLADVEAVYEFGCGSGHNLAELARLFPGIRLVGLDWAQAACDLADDLGRAFGWQLTGRRFDFFASDPDLVLPPGTAVVTIGGLEQVGGHAAAFVDWVLERRPRICVHVEPVVEWYDPADVLDQAAIRFHERRNYGRGLSERVAALAAAGQVEILRAQRCFVGSMFHENSLLVWRPVVGRSC